jgi:hypothetical protein
LLTLADEAGLVQEPAAVSKARADLTNPRQRLKAELRWFPGLAPNRAEKVAKAAAFGVPEPRVLVGAPPLATINALVSGLTSSCALGWPPARQDLLALVEGIAVTIDQVTPPDVLQRVNEDRSIAGFPLIDGIEILEAELHEWREEVRLALANVLRAYTVGDRHLVLHDAIVKGTDHGARHGPALVHELADALELDFTELSSPREEQVATEMEVLRRMASSGVPEEKVTHQVRWLELALKSWDAIAQPLQLSAQARGREHSDSQRLAGDLRMLAIHLHNEHGMTMASERITRVSQEVFAELVRTAERANDDLRSLEQLLNQRREQRANREEWERSITYEGVIGLVFKERIAVSPDGVRHKDTCIKLTDVTRVRWGGTRHSLNGIPTGTTYTVLVGNPHSVISFECRDQQAFTGFTGALWQAVGFRLSVELANRLREGERIQFGTCWVEDGSITLVKDRLFRKGEVRRFSWAEVSIASHGGSFHIAAVVDSGFSVSLGYLTHDNTHILEGLMRILWKQGGDALSGIFSDGGDTN